MVGAEASIALRALPRKKPWINFKRDGESGRHKGPDAEAFCPQAMNYRYAAERTGSDRARAADLKRRLGLNPTQGDFPVSLTEAHPLRRAMPFRAANPFPPPTERIRSGKPLFAFATRDKLPEFRRRFTALLANKPCWV